MKHKLNLRVIIHKEHHMIEDYKQRILTKDWKQILLDHEDTTIFNGEVRQIIAKNLGYGVVEISKVPKNVI